MQQRVWTSGFGILLLLVVPARGTECPGVRATNVQEKSVAFDIGMRDGDTLHTWRFVDPASARGIEPTNRICSVFDMWRLTMEVSPRGSVAIRGQRGGEEQTWRYHGGPRLTAAWEPLFPSPMVDSWALAKPMRNEASAEAEEAWERLLGLAEIHASVSDRVWILVERAFGLATHDHPEPGNEWFASAIDLADTGPSWMAAHVRWTQGRRGAGLTTEVATALVEDARGIWRSQEQLLSAAHAHEALGEIAYGRNDFATAEAHFLESEKLRAEVAPNSLDRATSLQNIGVTAFLRDDFPEAISRTAQARKILQGYRTGSQLVSVTSNLSAFYSLMGQTELQVEVGEDALQKSREIGLTGSTLAAALTNHSVATAALGDLARGESLARLAVVEAAAGSDQQILATAHHGVASIAEEQGDYAAAERSYRAAIEIQERMEPPPPELAVALISLGIVLTDRARPLDAKEVFLRAEQYLKEHAPDHKFVVPLHTGWAQLLLRQGDLTGALEHADLAVHRAELGPLRGSLAISANLARGSALVAMRRFETAQDQARKTLAMARQFAPGTAWEAQALELQGRVASADGRWPAAAEAFCIGVEILEHQISRLGRAVDNDVRFRSRHLGIFEGCAEARLASGDPAAAFHVLERSRAWKTRQTLALRGLLVTGEAKGELRARARRLASRHDELLEQLATVESTEAAAPVRSELQTLGQEREELVAAIRAANPRHRDIVFPTPLEAAAAARALQPRELLVAFEVTENATLAFTLDPTGRLQGKRLDIAEPALATLVDDFLVAIESRGSTSAVRQLAAQLYLKLLGPLTDIGRAERLIIVSDGPLLRLPWSALGHAGDEGARDWRWLIEETALFTVPSATVYAQLIERPPSDTDRIVAFGDPTLPNSLDRESLLERDGIETLRSLLELRGALEPLPASRDEIRSIERAYAGQPVQVFLGVDASETRARQLTAAERIIHFAGHAILDEENPLESGLVLSTPPTIDAGFDNGFLQAWEITDSLRLDAELVTLSACSTARGPELRGEGLQGLSQSFLHAGARSVPGTLWPVADRSTAVLMAAFYRESAAGLPRDEALRRAQIQMIRGEGRSDPTAAPAERGVGGLAPTSEMATEPLPASSAPYYWAAFSLLGDPN